MLWLSLLLGCKTEVKNDISDTADDIQTFVDADGDGYTEENDCDDSNSASIHRRRKSAMRLTMIAMVKSTMVLEICTIRISMAMGLVIPMRRCNYAMHQPKIQVL